MNGFFKKINLSDDVRYRVIEICAALGISLLLYFLSYTSPFQRLELLSLDARFNLRPPIETNPKVALIGIDDNSLATEGRWQDWTRDKHARIVDIVKTGKGALLGFDIFFSEESEQVLHPIDVEYADSLEELRALFPDYDGDLAAAAKRANNVYFGSTFDINEKSEDVVSLEARSPNRSKLIWKNLEFLASKGFAVSIDKAQTGQILQARSPEALPIPRLSEVAKGVGFAQIMKEADGVVRKYPTFIRCDSPSDPDSNQTHLFPSIGLAMACDYLQVPLQNVELRLGEYIRIPDASTPDGTKRDFIIPINEKGEMIINWAGDYEAAFRHFPYASLIELEKLRILQEVKTFLSTQELTIFDNLYPFLETVYGQFSEMPNSTQYIAFAIYLYGAHWYEIILSQDEKTEFGPSLFADYFNSTPEANPELYNAQRQVFADVRLNMAGLKLLSDEPDISASEMAKHLNITDEKAEEYHTILNQLVKAGGPGPADRPLYFRPPITIGGRPFSFDDLDGGVFFYGLTASGTHDLNPMPFSPRYPMVGALANVFNTIVTNQFITQMSIHWRFPLFLIIGFCAGFILSSSTAIRGSLFTVLFLMAYILFAYELFETKGVWIDVVGPIGIVILSDAAIVWHKFSTAEKKRKFIKNAFGYYMNPAVVEQIAKNPEMLELGGKKMELTAFFSDVASFTTISEKLTEHELVELLNEYLTEMTEIVLKHFGNLDKYEGDAIMAFFGAPLHFPDHATRACNAALEMQEQLVLLREKWKSQGRPELTARIGINTGPMIVGNMGSRNRFDYTVMGDAVNLASRLEGVNKQYSTDIMISEFTLEHCKSDIVTREIDLIRVKGKALPVRIYEVIGRINDTIPETMHSVIERFSLGLAAYKQKRWDDGIKEFQACLDIKPNDGPSRTYLKRCREYLESPPPEDWDGVYIMTTK